MVKKKDIENIEIRSEEVQEILGQMPKGILRWGNGTLLSLIVLLFILSWFIKYPDILTAEAILTTAIQPQKEFAYSTARIDTLLVTDQQEVIQNQALAVLENPAVFLDVYFLKKNCDSITVMNSSFYFPMEDLPILFLGELETAFASFENNYEQYTLNQKLLPFEREEVYKQYALSESKRRLENLQAQYQLNKVELNLKRKDQNRYQSLFENNVVSEQEYEQKQLEYLQSERNFKSLGLQISQLKEALEQAKFSTNTTQIDQTREEKKLLRNVIRSFQQLKKAIEEWEQKYVLKAEIKGKVTFLGVWAKNQWVQAGQHVFSIIPKASTDYVAKLKIPAFNTGKLKVGQTVHLKLINYPENEYGILSGTVSKISLTPNAENQYLLDVSVEAPLITSYKKQIPFTQEMQATADIITEDLRLIQRLFYQFNKLIDRHVSFP